MVECMFWHLYIAGNDSITCGGEGDSERSCVHLTRENVASTTEDFMSEQVSLFGESCSWVAHIVEELFHVASCAVLLSGETCRVK